MSHNPNFKPAILLAFANDDKAHLPLLEKESRTLEAIFKELSDQRPLQLIKVENADTTAISQKLLEEKQNIIIFHYGGHAEPGSLRLKDGLGRIEGLSEMLSDSNRLKLVFLNGCATHDQVDYLLKKKVKAVIATQVPVGDQSAYEFSKAFYESFAKGNTIQEAYKHACDFLMFKYKNLLTYQINKRSIGLDAEHEQLEEAAKWTLYYQDPEVLSFRGVGLEADKVQADAQLIQLINRFSKKIPIRILLAVSTHQKLPNEAISPVNVYNEVALIKEYIYKLFIYSNLGDKFDVQVYLLKDQRQASLIVASGEEPGVERELDLPDLSQIDLISWVIWNNLGIAQSGEDPPLSWLYRKAIDLPDSERPDMQLFRRGEAIPSFLTDGDTSERTASITKRAREVEKFFAAIFGRRTIDYHPDLFEEEFEHHLRIWFKKFVQNKHRTQILRKEGSSQLPEFPNPYRGLKPYQYQDANLFFGRVNEVDQLRDQLADPQHEGLLAVIGASGSGKSSLARAGLFNRLRLNAIPGSRNWRILECGLDEGRLQCREVWGKGKLPEEMSLTLDNYTTKGRAGAVLLIQELMQGRPSAARLVLFLDQFEEIFTLINDQQEHLRKGLLDFLVEFAQTDQGQVILTMRSEYFHHCLEYPDFVQLMKRGQQVVLPPDKESMIRIIVRPAMFSGLQFEKGLEMRVWEEAGKLAGALPLVSYVLEQLANKPEGNLLTIKAYEALGGVQGVIQRQADLAVQGFDTESETFKKDFNFLFRKLIKVEDGVEGKRPAPLNEGQWSAGAIALKDALISKRLLISDGDTLEIAHEALIRNWDLLQHWIIDTEAALLTLTKVGKEAADWRKDRQTVADLQQQVQLDRQRLWPHDRLQTVYDAQELLGIGQAELDKLYPHSVAFIRRESDRLCEELEYEFTDHQRRNEIGNRLALLTDRRPGVGLKDGLPDVVWCEVPGGKVDIAGIATPFAVKPFYIARYPVTLLQFDLFRQIDIYKKDQWWEGLPQLHWTYKPKPQSPENMNNRPAELVNWYHAVAFCRWLSSELGFTVRLPYEWEWQQAATNGDPENIYPWGKDWNTARANSSAGMGSLVAVGLYPHGMAGNGAMDMAGNAYEWCYNAFDIEEQSLEKTVKRTTRGGSWGKFDGPPDEVLKNTFRLGDFPHGINERNNDIRVSFRLAADQLPDSATVYKPSLSQASIVDLA